MKRQDLIAARESVDETQAEFAERLGVDQATLSSWETRGIPKHGPALRAVTSVLEELMRKEFRRRASRDG